MSLMEVLGRRRVLSFEVSPPRTDAGMKTLCGEDGALRKLCSLHPDFISCTYDAGGADAGKNLELLDAVLRDGRTTGVTHFTCIGNTRADIRAQLQTYLDHGIHHILALRGELPSGWSGAGGELHHAAQLVAFVRQEFADRFTIAVAGAPEGNIASSSPEADIDCLKQKQDSGADFIITQLCWDMDRFRYWLDTIRAAGIRLPVVVRVLPVLDQAEVINMAFGHGGCVMPRALCEIISRNWIYPNPFVRDPFDAEVERKKADFRKAGIAYTIDQISQYRECDVSGIHLCACGGWEDTALIVRESGIQSPA